ncbi:enoyl-CoA hydratase/isomerase family protein [Streptomyces sasae]|uniref:enoyl-CoA hydratase/isomerase family protein n=1 Tax=Streptomyces sasae TaxID=1266772 RepID=UPI002931E72F|nr:enoyl-CoA hydratase/isomerase family protein [Streptomyces sasae]
MPAEQASKPGTADLPVLTEQRDRTLVITLNRPRKYNAFNSEMIDLVTSSLRAADADPAVRAVIITGAGPAFAAGADIGEYASADSADFQAFTTRANTMCDTIAGLRLPVIAAVHGLALGGGFEVVLSCDLVVADHGASFGLPEISLGLMPGWGGTQRLTRHVGVNRAKDMILTGARISTERAHELGIVTHIGDDGTALERARHIAGELARGPAAAITAIKATVDHAHTDTTVFTVEQRRLHALFDTADGQEGIRAFVDKRRAEFGAH